MKVFFTALVPALTLSVFFSSAAAEAGDSLKKDNGGGLYLRLQQAPLIGLAAVSDSGVIDVELMKSVHKHFWIGPTIVAHAHTSEGSKMRSLNLGVRADFILPAFGNIDEGVYVSTALLLGSFKSETKIETPRWSEKLRDVADEVTCDFKSEGVHRAGAFVVGKQFSLNDDLHVTAGLGVVKSKVMSSNQSGFCSDKSVVKSEGRSLPWIDLGVGFKL
jgi:hypothetical protein